MAKPILTNAERALYEKDRLIQVDLRDTLTAAIPGKNQEILDLTNLDLSLQAFFDYYNAKIVKKYDTEREKLDGTYVAVPISETDVQECASALYTTRTFPVTPDTDMTRVAEFDGGGLTTTDSNEQFNITEQTVIEDILKNGITSAANAPFSLTTGVITAASTTLNTYSPTTSPTFNPGNRSVVQNGVDIAIIEVVSSVVTPDGGGGFSAVVDFTFITPPLADIPVGADFSSFGGFTDGERNTKTAGNQNLMNYLVSILEVYINGRITELGGQKTSALANEDPDAVAALATSVSRIDVSSAFLTAYLVGTDISDVGIATLVAEKLVRSPQITSRVAEILAAYTGQTENYYDKRYIYANARASLAFGAVRRKKTQQEAIVTMNKFIADAIDQIAFIDAILS